MDFCLTLFAEILFRPALVITEISYICDSSIIPKALAFNLLSGEKAIFCGCNSFFFFFQQMTFFPPLHQAACGILVPWPGIEPESPAAELQSTNHWTVREVPVAVALYRCHSADAITVAIFSKSCLWFVKMVKAEKCSASAPSPVTSQRRMQDTHIPGGFLCYDTLCPWASLVARLVKNSPTMQETPVWFLGWEGPLGNG